MPCDVSLMDTILKTEHFSISTDSSEKNRRGSMISDFWEPGNLVPLILSQNVKFNIFHKKVKAFVN